MAEHDVVLLTATDCEEKICAASGRISTQSGNSLDIFKRSHDIEKNKALIEKVLRSGHTSTTEHISFGIAFNDVSVVVEQFMIEFRLASFTVKSRRYVDFSSSGYYVPDALSAQDKAIFCDVMDSLFTAYTDLCNDGIPKEDARFLLPYCFYSNFYCSLNGREMINVLKAMLFGRGRHIKEIYDIGKNLLNQCIYVAPGIFDNFEERYGKYSDTLELDFDCDCEYEHTGYPTDSKCDILSFTEKGEELVCLSALCEMGYSVERANKIISDESNVNKILDSLTHCDRARALESFNATVKFNNVSLACLTHFARHRMQSILIPELMKADRYNYVLPESIKADSKYTDIYIKGFEDMAALYEELKGKGYSKDVLVYCVLSGNTIDIVSTINGRELRLFMNLRSCTRAQWEIQEYAVELLAKLRGVAPTLFSFFGPSCYVKGYCPEGKMTCGKAAEMKEIFESLK